MSPTGSRSVPTTGFAQRLEAVRRQAGCDTIREFYELLKEAGGYRGSYASARAYHRNREPTTSYLRAVWEVSGASLEYLFGRKS